ncbi:MAG TPA: fibronectin type III domain-containing protein, partial [Isosphaeraceae bacterium]|nr:fibronectin type III domain-containing protein [Isosphaeraceae bacterium]
MVVGIGCSKTQGADQNSSPLRLEVTRDTWVSEVGPEADGNNGSAPRLKLKSIQEMSLVDIDTSLLAGRTVRSAVLHLKKTGDETLKRVTVSSVGAEWVEGTGSGYTIQPGSATFRRRRHPDLPWSIAGGDICHVVLGNGGTLWRMADASPPDSDGWQHIPVDPRVVAARVAGLSYGFLLFDDTGSEWTRTGDTFTQRIFPNRFVYSREQNRSSAPYFTIELGPEDRRPPPAPSDLRVDPGTSLLPPGEALVSWVTPPDDDAQRTLGFFVILNDRPVPRELIPLAVEAGGRVVMHLRDLKLEPERTHKLSVQAVDGAGNRGTAASAEITVSRFMPTPLPQPKPPPAAVPSPTVTAWPQIAGMQVAIIDELDKVHPATGELIPPEFRDYLATNHLWNAETRTIALHAARNEFVAFQVLIRGNNTAALITPALIFDGQVGKTIPVELGRYFHVPTTLGALPDPVVPLNFPTRPTPAAKSQGLHVEVYVPHSTLAGLHRGFLTLSSPTTNEALRLPVELTVWDFTLPDHLSFVPEMNSYDLPENERDYYRLAHRHRTVLNRLPYHQNGNVSPGCAPLWDSRRLVFGWSQWDRRFGPLLDGSAFADLPRKNVPVECFYLPLHESWPSPMEGNYNGDYWADRAFPESYRRAFVAAARQMAAHFQTKQWNQTLFHGFLNNKNNFKTRGWSTASSPWLLDEPANFQDYWAIQYFARAFHEGINQATGGTTPATASLPRMVFRADISRPQWQRDTLDGLLDYNVVSSAVRTYPLLVMDRKRTWGQIVVEYGSTNPVEGSNLQPVAWCLDAWSMGLDGVLP